MFCRSEDLSQVEVKHRNQMPLCEAISERQTLHYAAWHRSSKSDSVGAPCCDAGVNI